MNQFITIVIIIFVVVVVVVVFLVSLLNSDLEWKQSRQLNVTRQKRENNRRPQGPTPMPVATTSNPGWPVKLTNYNSNGDSYLLVQEIFRKLYLKKTCG